MPGMIVVCRERYEAWRAAVDAGKSPDECTAALHGLTVDQVRLALDALVDCIFDDGPTSPAETPS